MSTTATDHTTNSENPTIAEKERTAQFLWLGFIIAFFVMQAILWIVAIGLTANDPSHAVVEDYDRIALNWDEHKQLREASEALGWQLDWEIDTVGDVYSQHTVKVGLRDGRGGPVEDAALKVRAFHRGHAANAQTIAFQEMAPGVYVAQLEMRRSGWWVFRGRAERHGETFLIDDRQLIELAEK